MHFIIFNVIVKRLMRRLNVQVFLIKNNIVILQDKKKILYIYK